MTIPEALTALRPKASWTLRGSEYSGLEWHDEDQTQPTEQEINDYIAAHDYRDKRASEYPPLTDLADSLVHQANGDNTQFEAYVAACNAVKAKYPKP